MSILSKKFSTILRWNAKPTDFYREVFKEEPYEYQKRVLNDIARNYKTKKRIMILAASGTGKTKLLACIGLFYATVIAQMERKPKEVIILSGSQLQARKVYGYIREAIKSHEIIKTMVTSKPRQSDTEFVDGSKIKALPNSLTATQGQHGDLVIVDEAALVSDFQLNDCFRIIGANDGMIIWSGTPTVFDSKFVRDFEDESSKLKKGEYSEWTIYSWSAKDCPALKDMYNKMKEELPEEMFQIFWEGTPFALTGTLVPRDALVNAIRGIREFKYDPNKKTIFGIDWGWADPTTLVIVQTDGEKYYVLEAYSWKETDFDRIHEFIEMKAKELKPYRIFTDSADVGENLRLRKRGLPVFGIAFNKEKAMLQGRLRDLFVKGNIYIPDVDNKGLNRLQDLIQQLRVYTWTTSKGEDLVDALMLACKEIQTSSSSTFTILMGRTRRRKDIAPF